MKENLPPKETLVKSDNVSVSDKFCYYSIKNFSDYFGSRGWWLDAATTITTVIRVRAGGVCDALVMVKREWGQWQEEEKKNRQFLVKPVVFTVVV